MILLVPSAHIRQVCHMSRHFICPEDMFVDGGFILLCGMSLGICTQIYKFCMWYDFLMVWYVFMHSFLLTPFGCVSLNRLVIAYASNILILSSVVFVAVVFESIFVCRCFALFLLLLLCLLLLAGIWYSYFVQMLRMACWSRNSSVWFECNKCNKKLIPTAMRWQT
jgi:hypothetical protein